MNLSLGQKSRIEDLGLSSSSVFNAVFKVTADFQIDFECFGLNESGKLHSDPWLTFYNQPLAPQGAVALATSTAGCEFSVDLSKVPSDVSRLVLTLTSDTKPVSALRSLSLTVGTGVLEVTGSSFNQELALIVGEFYRKDGGWRFGVIGQGFNGGLSPLLAHFGGEEDKSSNPNIPVTSSVDLKKKVFLEKRISLEKKIEATAPKLVSLTKKAAVSLEKRNLGEHKAKVAICLDISASMSDMYSRGVVQEFVERILALGCRLDDDGSIDVFLFGENGHKPSDLTISDFSGYIPRMLKEFPLEYDTKYSTAMELVRKFYVPNYNPKNTSPTALEYPVYVMFVTDGVPSDKSAAVSAITHASYEPIFWQFLGVGTGSFSFLEKLDDLTGRYVDNADFFSMNSLNSMTDDQLFDRLMNEYPSWLKQVTAKNLVTE